MSARVGAIAIAIAVVVPACTSEVVLGDDRYLLVIEEPASVDPGCVDAVDGLRLDDVSPAAGVQIHCFAYQTRSNQYTALPACGTGVEYDCYELVPDTARCHWTQHHLRLDVRRGAIPPEDLWVQLVCRHE